MVLGRQGLKEWVATDPQVVAMPMVRMAAVALLEVGRQEPGPMVLLGWAMWVQGVPGQALRAAWVEASQAHQWGVS